jgi:hypothetical protein
VVKSAALWMLLLSGCSRLPESFPPPRQAAALAPDPMAAMSDANAGDYIEEGFREKSEGPWRWAHEHPVLRFHLPLLPRAKFHMTFALPEQTFRLTGPVTLTFSVNGHVFDRARYDKAGEQQYTHEVPAEFLKPDATNLVAIDSDRAAVPNPPEKLTFVLIRAGFTE